MCTTKINSKQIDVKRKWKKRVAFIRGPNRKKVVTYAICSISTLFCVNYGDCTCAQNKEELGHKMKEKIEQVASSKLSSKKKNFWFDEKLN